MNADAARLLALAEAVADGRPLDWGAAESDTASDEERALVRELRLLAGVAEGHRSVDDRAAAAGVATTGPAEPQQWGVLEIRERLGAGAFGAVYRAWDPRLARDVALKLLHADRLDDRQAPAVIEEGRLLARVRHPHVITVYGADRFDGRVGIWMEFIRGRTLEDVLRQSGPLGAREAASIGADLCAALAAVHSVDLVHRDVKTTNVMREDGGRIVLMDFGAGQELDLAGRDAGMTGTPSYMAPEIFEGGTATPRSDLYSLGVLLFRAVTRAYPVPGRTTAEIRAAHARGERRRLIDVRADLPPAFVRVVERAIAPDPAERYDTAGAMAADLVRAFEPAGVTPSPAPGPDRVRTRRRNLIVATALAVVALAIAGVVSRDWIADLLAGPARNIVVLPLANLSGDPAQDYLAAGVTEILMGRLMMIRSLRIMERSSLAALPAGERDAASLHRRLSAEYVVEGSVHRQADRIRVVARLVHASTGTLQWTETYERPLGDLFALQGEVARAIGSEIGARLTGDVSKRLMARQTTSNEAQDAYLQGRYLMYQFNRGRIQEARDLFLRAVTLDPSYAVAHASLARAYGFLLEFDIAPARDVQPLAVAAATRAVELDANLAETNVAYADAKYRYDHDWDAADEAYRRALAIAPHASIVLTPYSRFLGAAGRLDEALERARAGEHADPLSAEMIASVGILHYYRRDFGEARAAFERAAAVAPRYPGAPFGLGRVASAEGQYGAAIAHIRHAIDLAGDHATYRAELARNYFLGGWQNLGEQILGGLLLDASRGPTGVNYEAIGYIYAALGDLDRAFEWLNRSFEHYHARLLFVNVDPRADPLRADPRFAALVRRLGLQP